MAQTQEQNINLTAEQKENYADKLLVYMKNELENQGETIKTGVFDFHISYVKRYFNAPDETICEGNDLSEFKKTSGINDETFLIIMKYCFTYQYVKKMCMGQVKFDNVALTESGFARATSVVRAEYKKAVTDNTQNIHIGSINGDNVQIGNNNVQNITSSFQYLIDEINKSNATDKEKEDALTKLQEFIYNPIVCNILSSGVVETIKRLIGA